MAIDLPPVIPPQASTAEKIENYAALNSASVIERNVAGYTIRITGNKYLTEQQIDTIMNAAQTPAQAVNAINQAYYQLGHLLVTVYYAHKDKVVYAHVVNGKLAKITAPEAIADYFDELLGDEHLTRAEFDENRVLADIKAQRMGVDYSVSYQLEGNPQEFTMVFTPSEVEDHDPTKITLGLNNLGNRFLGRYFASAGISHDFSNGLNFNFNYDRGMTEWGETNGGDSYDAYTLKFNAPSPWGLYGIEGRYVEYARDVVLTLVTDSSDTSTGDTDTDGGCLLGLDVVCGLVDSLLGDNNALSSLLGGGALNSVLGTALPAEESSNDDGTVTTQDIAFRIESESTSVALTGEQILLSDSFQRLIFSQRLEFIDNTIELMDVGTLLDESYSTLELGLKFNRVMRLFGLPTQIVAQGFAEAGLSSDSGTLGTSNEEGSVAIGRRSSEFLVLKPRLTGKLSVSDWASLNLQFISQFSNDTQLPLQQQFVLGGSALSAYLPGVLVGDSGTFSKLSFSGNKLPAFGMTFQPAIFVEHGQAWYEDADGVAGDARQIADAGLSLSASWKDIIKTDLIAAVPVSDDNVDQQQLKQSEVDFFWSLKVIF
jgi:hemolysin activation/secretion protein